MPLFSRKRFQLRHSKTCIKLKNALFKCWEHSFLSSRKIQNHFVRSFLWPNFNLNSFERFGSLSQKIVSTSSLKNLQKTAKCTFQKLRTCGFYRVASKPFSEMLTMTNFGFKDFWTLCLALTVSGFNFVPQKFTKKVKNIKFESSKQLFFPFR